MTNDIRFGDLCLAVGNLTDALVYYRKALTSVPDVESEVRLEALLKISSCLRRQGRADAALEMVTSAMPSSHGRHRRDLLAEKATLLCLAGRYGEAAGVCEEALREEPAAERGKDAGIYLVLGHVLSRLCKWKQAAVCLEQAATFARMSGDLHSLGNALNNLGIVYKNLCRLDVSAKFLRRAVRVARRTHDDASLAVRLLNLAVTLLKRGDTRAAVEAVDECARISALLNLVRTANLACVCKARLCGMRGDFDEAERLLAGLTRDPGGLDEPRVGYLAREALGEILCEKGEAAKAREVLEACLGEVAGSAKDIEAEVASRLGQAYLALGMKESARVAAERAARLAEETGDLYELGRSLRVLGLALDDGETAQACLCKAARIFRRMGADLEYALTLGARAAARETTGPLAAKLLSEAAAIFEASDASHCRVRALCAAASISSATGRPDRALAALAQADETVGRVPHASHLAGLVASTRVEVDQHVSRSLAARSRLSPTNAEEAFDMLRCRCGIACLVVGRPDGPSAGEVISFHGTSAGAAASVLGLARAAEAGPLVLTGISGSDPSLTKSGLRSLLAVPLAVPPGGGSSPAVSVVCWRPGGSQTHCEATSTIAEAYNELVRLEPILAGESAARGEASEGSTALCLAGFLTLDAGLRRVLLSLPRIARTRANVLVAGETGTGKELVARAIHSLSPRSGGPFVAQNCAALHEHLLESELFGHKAGAFTDARADKRGLLEAATGGTFFLDEVGDVSAATQAKMLRAIESGEIRRLGDTAARPIDVRFVAATNKRLEEEVEQGRFRRDLYYRLNVVTIELPPLRQRQGDVVLLARLFLTRLVGPRRVEIDRAAMQALAGYRWPGNVRQLENEIQRAVAMLGPSGTVTADLLSASITGGRPTEAAWSLREELRAVERSRIVAVLERYRWNKTHAARALGDISRPALVAKMKRLGIPLARREPRSP